MKSKRSRSGATSEPAWCTRVAQHRAQRRVQQVRGRVIALGVAPPIARHARDDARRSGSRRSACRSPPTVLRSCGRRRRRRASLRRRFRPDRRSGRPIRRRTAIRATTPPLARRRDVAAAVVCVSISIASYPTNVDRRVRAPARPRTPTEFAKRVERHADTLRLALLLRTSCAARSSAASNPAMSTM